MINTAPLLEQVAELIPFLETLKTNKTDLYQPIAEGKWSAAAIISHLMYWDCYMIEMRLQGMLKGASLPEADIDVHEYNRQAEDYAHSGVDLEELLDEVIETRRIILDRLANRDLSIVFTIRGLPMTIAEYLADMIEHDRHHIRQIETFLHR